MRGRSAGVFAFIGREFFDFKSDLGQAISQSSCSNPHFMQRDLLVGSICRLRKGEVAAPSKYHYIDRPSYKWYDEPHITASLLPC
jgi:hypothetical protein